MRIYSTQVKEIGPEASEFLDSSMMVLFGFNAPPELRPYCFLITQSQLSDSIEAGDIIIIDDVRYNITCVGNQVNKNLRDLGHITINFKGEPDSSMAGTLYTENKPINGIHVGTKITIEKK